MKLQHLLFETADSGVALLTVNRPEMRNALNADCWKELDVCLDRVNGDAAIRLLIITGAGEKAFVGGADINFLKERTVVNALEGLAQSVLRKLDHCAKPTIALVNGSALGGGCELAMACDIRVASENARFGLPEISLGILPAAGGSQRLAKLIGLGRAKHMILTGQVMSAEEALHAGLVTLVVPLASLLEKGLEVAATILEKAPLAVRLVKRVVSCSLSTDEETGMLLETLSYGLLMGSADKREGVEAFLEKRKPRFTGQ